MADETAEQKRQRILFVLVDAQYRLARLMADVLGGDVTDVDYWLNDTKIELNWPAPSLSWTRSSRMEAETAMARYRGGKYLRWAWKPTTVTPFWGLTTFKGEWIIGLYPLVIEIGIRQRVMWERLDRRRANVMPTPNPSRSVSPEPTKGGNDADHIQQ